MFIKTRYIFSHRCYKIVINNLDLFVCVKRTPHGHLFFSSYKRTSVQHRKFYVHNNTFHSVISEIRMNLPLVIFKGKNITESIMKDFIDNIIYKEVMTIFKLYILFAMYVCTVKTTNARVGRPLNNVTIYK